MNMKHNKMRSACTMKAITQKKKNHMEKMDGAKYREQALNFLILSRHTTLPNLHMFTNPEVLWLPSFWDCIEALLLGWPESSFRSFFLRRYGNTQTFWPTQYIDMIKSWLNHWLLAVDSSSSPSALPQCQGDKTESSKPLITCLVPLASSPILRWDLLTKQKTLLSVSSLKGFRNSDPEIEAKTKCIFLIINHYMTSP